MDKCQFSEFSYGYCLTEDLIIGQGTPITAAPVFPSLIEEGQQGKGYDVAFARPGIPLFLQFKLVHQMVRGTAVEAKRKHFLPPFYRMHLRPRKISDQHDSLLSLEQAGNEVFYVAPGFHTSAELNTNYAQHRVWDRSFKITPGRIGPLPDDKSHHITFRVTTGEWRLYSDDPTKRGEGLSSQEIAANIEVKIKERGGRNLRDQVEELDANLTAIVNARNRKRIVREHVNLEELFDRDPLQRVAYLARQFFDCQMLFASLR